MDRDSKKLMIGVEVLRAEYGLGRDMARQLVALLPHVVIGGAGAGKKRLVLRDHVNNLIKSSAIMRINLWDLLKNPEKYEIELMIEITNSGIENAD